MTAAAVKHKRSWRHHPLVEGALILFGICALAYGIRSFVEPNHLVTGGATGIGIIGQAVCERLFGFKYPLWMSTVVLNVPLFIMALKVFGKEFTWKSLISTALFSTALWAADFLPPIPTGGMLTATINSDLLGGLPLSVVSAEGDLLLAAVFGGAMDGFGIGLVLSNRSTTGGSDTAAMLLHHFNKHWPVSQIILVMNAVIISVGAFIYGPRCAMYAIICVFVSSRVVNTMLEGLSFSKAAFIISDKADEISARVMTEMHRGVTGLAGKGMFTGKAKNVTLCVVSQKEIVRLKAIVQDIDDGAFVIVTDVREVMGKGFRSQG